YLCGLLFVLSLVAETFQQDTTAAPVAGASTDSAGGDKPGTAESAKPESSAGNNPASGSGSKCKPSEVMTQSGCYDRDSFFNNVIIRSWNDEGFDTKKQRSGRVQGSKCIAGKVMTPDGCRNMMQIPHDDEVRVPVRHSSLVGTQVVHSYHGAHLDLGKHKDNHDVKTKKKSRNFKGPTIQGHNRPRPFAYIPGRLLRSRRQCRPYETLGRDGKCIRRTALRTGKYEHRNHYYGLQKRHRHENAE
ncbi:hypothetical protein KR074_001888, partial [Drosophila pseudoananassae]